MRQVHHPQPFFSLPRLPVDVFAKLSCLRKLELQGNQLSRFPMAACAITSLEELDIRQQTNKMTGFVPEKIAQLSRLTVLRLDNNLLSAAAEDPGWRGLMELTGLRVLGLAWNQISELPEGMGKRKRLGVIWLQGNPIQRWPASMDRLRRRRITIVN